MVLNDEIIQYPCLNVTFPRPCQKDDLYEHFSVHSAEEGTEPVVFFFNLCAPKGEFPVAEETELLKMVVLSFCIPLLATLDSVARLMENWQIFQNP